MIRAKNISKSFMITKEKKHTVREHVLSLFKRTTSQKLTVLNDISFHIKKGEFVGIVGRNGSGKSTLLKILAGIYRPDKGSSLTMKGTISPFLELGVGFHHELTARENVYFNGKLLGLTTKEIEERFDQIIAFAELEDFVEQKLKFFSSGMQVRLAFAVAMHVDADIYLLDEVLAVGDASFQAKCFEVFRTLQEKGKTIVFVSHDLGSMRRFCDRILYLEEGDIVAEGTPSEVIDQYLYGFEEKEEEAVATPQETSEHQSEGSMKGTSITKVELRDQKGKKRDTVVTGAPIEVTIHYETTALHKNVVVGIALYRDDGVHVYGTNSLLQKRTFNLQKKGTLSFKTDSLSLLDGTYQLTVALHDSSGNNYDWKDKWFTFKVHGVGQAEGVSDLQFEFQKNEG